MEFTMRTIGRHHSFAVHRERQTPIQASRSQAIGMVEIYPEFAGGLKDIEVLSYIYLLYAFHASSGYTLQVKPFLDNQEYGIFATWYPYRPSPIGISIVKLLFCRENFLTNEGIDTLDGTPLLDIKPYIPDSDSRTEVRVGWYETRSEK